MGELEQEKVATAKAKERARKRVSVFWVSVSVCMPTGKRHPKLANQPNDAGATATAAVVVVVAVYVLPSDTIE